MIHVSGLGMAGSYLYRRLSDDGFDVTAYDPKRASYYLPCGYATNEHLLGKFLNNVNLSLDDYVLSRSRTVTFSGSNFGEVAFNSRGMCTIDKKRLEEDLARGASGNAPAIGGNGAEIRIDATGISRALLGRHEHDYTMYAKEYLTGKSTHDDFYFYFFEKGHGYFWEFPMGGKFHVGAGSDSLSKIDTRLGEYLPETVTGRKIRLTPLFDRVSRGNIIGVGEAIGTVSPISGEGIVPSVRSAEILFQCLTKYTGTEEVSAQYVRRIREEFGHYGKLRNLVRKIQNGEKLGLSDLGAARAAKKDLEMFGVDFRISKVIGHFL